MTVLGIRKTIESAQVDLNTATGDLFTFTPGQPVDILRWGIIADALVDVGAGMVLKADHVPTAGSGTGRGDGNVGDITTGANDLAQGAGLFTEDVSGAGNKTPFQVDPGEQVVWELTDVADTAGTAIIFVEYIEHPFVGDSNVTAGDFSNRIANMTSND